MHHVSYEQEPQDRLFSQKSPNCWLDFRSGVTETSRDRVWGSTCTKGGVCGFVWFLSLKQRDGNVSPGCDCFTGSPTLQNLLFVTKNTFNSRSRSFQYGFVFHNLIPFLLSPWKSGPIGTTRGRMCDRWWISSANLLIQRDPFSSSSIVDKEGWLIVWLHTWRKLSVQV